MCHGPHRFRGPSYFNVPEYAKDVLVTLGAVVGNGFLFGTYL